MERRTILTALAAAPLAALATTAHALGRRRRQCDGQPSYSAAEVSKGVDTPVLTLMREPNPAMPEMPNYRVKVSFNVTTQNFPGVAESVMTVEVKLLNESTGDPVTIPDPPSTGWPHGAGLYEYDSQTYNVSLIPNNRYLAMVTITINKTNTGLSTPKSA